MSLYYYVITTPTLQYNLECVWLVIHSWAMHGTVAGSLLFIVVEFSLTVGWRVGFLVITNDLH